MKPEKRVVLTCIGKDSLPQPRRSDSAISRPPSARGSMPKISSGPGFMYSATSTISPGRALASAVTRAMRALRSFNSATRCVSS